MAVSGTRQILPRDHRHLRHHPHRLDQFSIDIDAAHQLLPRHPSRSSIPQSTSCPTRLITSVPGLVITRFSPYPSNHGVVFLHQPERVYRLRAEQVESIESVYLHLYDHLYDILATKACHPHSHPTWTRLVPLILNRYFAAPTTISPGLTPTRGPETIAWSVGLGRLVLVLFDPTSLPIPPVILTRAKARR